jgi:hypothetical protein
MGMLQITYSFKKSTPHCFYANWGQGPYCLYVNSSLLIDLLHMGSSDTDCWLTNWLILTLLFSQLMLNLWLLFDQLQVKSN